MSNIGQNIKKRRIELGITADQLAERLKKSRATIYRYESSDADNMPISVLTPLAKELRTTPAELMGWASPPPKVTTRTAFDNRSPLHALTQAYLRRPPAVQKEIMRRLEELDTTFSQKVSKLLQASGNINDFIKGTGLPFPVVGSFMQGERVDVTPDEAERIAKFFNANVVDLFFDTVPPQAKEAPLAPSLPSPAAFQVLDKRCCQPIYRLLEAEAEENIHIENALDDYKELLVEKGTVNLLHDVFNMIEEKYGFDVDYDRVYRIIVNEIVRKDFRRLYVNHGHEGAIRLMTLLESD